MILLDTGVIISLFQGRLLEEGEEYAASILSRAELEFGVNSTTGLARQQRRKKLELADELFDWLPYTLATSRAFGLCAAMVHTHVPAQARRLDTHIAAQALEHEVPLLTTNPKDFRQLAAIIEIKSF